MVHIEDVLLYMVSQKADRYIFGAEAKASDPNPSAFDCSELVEWACARAGVTPKMPDGAFNQWKHCKRIPVGEALLTRGALLFVGDGTGSGRDAITHVAGSLGDGTTIEARGSKWGVGTWPSVNRFDFAGLIPGVDYSPGHGRLDQEDPFMALSDEKQDQLANNAANVAYAMDHSVLPTLAYLVGKVGGDDVDEDKIAGLVLAGLPTAKIADAILQGRSKADAQALLDALHDRLEK